MFNGETMKESEVRLSRQDADGFIHGCFDTTRTFNGAPFALEEHVARLFRTMKHLGITSPYTAAEYIAMNKAVLEQNKAMVAEADCWITTKVCHKAPTGYNRVPTFQHIALYDRSCCRPEPP
jgi:branched-subunit amino acid aminotransferase/4-amino-4-deoxychorismate lyase